MERSLKRAEKLVHATNSALAQMKFSLMFDDGPLGGEKAVRGAEALQPVFCGDGDDLKQCQDQFKVEANEMLSKMDKMFGSADASRRNWKPLDRIKEINRKMNALRQDHPKLRGAEQSSEKVVSLLAEEKLSPPVKSSSKGSLRTKPPSPCKTETEPPEKRHRTPKKPHSQSPVKSKEELRSNILETRQIVDRGLHTARHLAQKVESMTRNDRKEKTATLEKAVSDTNLRSLDGRSDSNETMKSGRHGRPSGRQEQSGDSVGGGQASNARVVDVKRRDCQRSRRRNLRVQRLPSVDIRGGLQLQKVHSLEIPGWGGAGGGKANTGIHILSHERIERAKMDEILNNMGREGMCCSEVRGNSVECTNCGKVMRLQGMRVDPRRVDEILRKCRFNVFDPRIDEFVEKYAATDAWKECEKSDSAGKAKAGSDAEEKAEAERSEVQQKAVRGFSLEDLSKRLSTKYRQEAEELEGHHLRLDGLLKSLFRKIDESREVFEECHLLRNGKVECAKVLTKTEPVVVSLMSRTTADGRWKKEKLDKRDVKNRNKSRTEERELKSSEEAEGTRMTAGGRDARRKRNFERKSKKESEERVMPVWQDDGGAGEQTGSSREAAERERRTRPPAPTFSDRSWGFIQKEAAFRKENAEGASMSSVQGRMTGLRMARGGKGAKRSELKEEGKASGATSMQSSGSSSPEKQGFGGHMPEGDLSPEALMKREEMESSQVATSVSNGEKAPSEVSIERSENNYESDFESLTNEAEEGGGEYEDVEPEVDPGDKKLSTISEVDSELEKKLSEEQKTQRGSLNSSGLLDEPKPSDISHVKGRHSASLTPEVSHETSKAEYNPSLKSTPTELVTSLKEILSALKDQFARTETLAEKLTENVRQDKTDRAEVLSRSPSEDGVPSPWKFPVERLVDNLRSARKESAAAPKPGSARSRSSQNGGMSADSLSDEGGSSLGEIVEGAQRKCQTSPGHEGSCPKLSGSRKSSWLSSAQKEPTKIVSESKPNLNSEEVSYSEGEIPSNLMVDSECCSSRSVGEVHQ